MKTKSVIFPSWEGRGVGLIIIIVILSISSFPQVKVTDLPAITTIDSADVIPIVDLSADTTKKVTEYALFYQTHKINKVLENTKSHCFYAFEDSSVEIELTQNTWTHITNASHNLFTAVQDLTGFTMSGDTIQFTDTDSMATNSIHIIFHWGIDGHAGNGEDYEVRVFNITKNAGVIRKAEGTTTGTSNRLEIGTSSYATSVNYGDKFVLQIQNKTDNDNFTIENGSIYAEVSHY